MRTSELPNIGPVLEGHLRAAGIETAEQLRAVGAEEAFCRVRASASPTPASTSWRPWPGRWRGSGRAFCPRRAKRRCAGILWR